MIRLMRRIWKVSCGPERLLWLKSSGPGRVRVNIREVSSSISIVKLADSLGSVEAFPRMHDIRYRMVDRGVRAEPLQPHWCALRPGKLSSGAGSSLIIGVCVGDKVPGAP